MGHKILLKCRICLDDYEEGDMVDLFAEKSNGNGSGSALKLNEKVEYCCGVRIRESTEMPSKICAMCFDMTRVWYNFRQLCVKSQVYLESLCTDRDRPPEADDSEYLHFLFEDLLLFRSAPSTDDAELDSNLNQSSSVNDDTSEELYESFLNEAEESDVDLAEMEENIKSDEESRKKENSPKQRHSFRGKKGKNSNKKDGFSTRKRYRPFSPSAYMCSICGNVYTKKASFSYHMSMHSNSRPHECELCGKKFRQTSELRNHIRRHTGERPYKCTYCDRHFIDRSEKHRHERVHTNTRPYVCNICGKSFMYSAILKNHLKLHSGEKNYNCLICQKAFTLQHQLKAHLQTITHKQKEAQLVVAGYDVLYENINGDP